MAPKWPSVRAHLFYRLFSRSSKAENQYYVKFEVLTAVIMNSDTM
jgi:hypothetical protein